MGIKQCGLENRLNKANMECSWIEFGFFIVENSRFMHLGQLWALGKGRTLQEI